MSLKFQNCPALPRSYKICFTSFAKGFHWVSIFASSFIPLHILAYFSVVNKGWTLVVKQRRWLIKCFGAKNLNVKVVRLLRHSKHNWNPWAKSFEFSFGLLCITICYINQSEKYPRILWTILWFATSTATNPCCTPTNHPSEEELYKTRIT